MWEFITNKIVADMIDAHPDDPMTACRKIVSLAYELWLQYEIRTDDITIIALYLENHINEDMSTPTSSTQIDPFESKELTAYPPSPAHVQRPVRRAVSRSQRQRLLADTESWLLSIKNLDITKPIEELMKEKYFPKTPEQKSHIYECINNSTFMFRKLSIAQKEDLVRVMYRREVTAGEVVLSQGEEEDCFYIVENGKYDVRMKLLAEDNVASNNEVTITTYDSEEHPTFGELSLT